VKSLPLLTLLALCYLESIPANAETNDPALLTLQRIFGAEEFHSESWGPACWLKDGSGFTTLETSDKYKNDIKNKDAQDVVRYNPQNGRKEIIVSATDLIPPGTNEALKIDDYAWSDDTSKLIVFTNSKRVWRRATRGDYYVFDLRRKLLIKLGGKAKPSTLMFATLSPDGRKVAYVCERTVFVESLDSGHITRLSSRGSDTIINGTSDWVNEEEFDLRNGLRWSPDSKYVAYWQFDTSGVREYSLINNTDSLYPAITSYAYPKAGETNSACRIGIVSVKGGKTHWFHVNGDPRNHYIPALEWAKDSSGVVIQRLNRLQNTNQLIFMSCNGKESHVILTETDAAWVEVMNNWQWMDKGKRFLWLSERDGWQHLYSIDPTTRETKLITPGNFDVIELAGMDVPNGWVYFIASPTNAAQRYLYRTSLDGSENIVQISPTSQPGTHSYEFSQDCRYAIHTYSSFGNPPVIDLVELPSHHSIRVLEDNAKLRAKVALLQRCPTEFFRVGISNGVALDGWCIKPSHFDPSKKYPVLFHVYGEPAGQTVLDRWGGENFLWHWMLAQQGYFVMSVDNRGTPAPRGREWRKSIYRKMGVIASADQAAAVQEILRQRSYLASDRVGIWGWSGGGAMSLNAIFRYPDIYRTAMAVAFVSDERFYDTIYEERYMGLPAENKEDYKNASAITFAKQLKGNLLLVHGTGDDNCHYQNFEVLVNELIKENKSFSMMSYPNRTHSIREGKNTKLHLFETLTEFLKEKLPLLPQK